MEIVGPNLEYLSEGIKHEIAHVACVHNLCYRQNLPWGLKEGIAMFMEGVDSFVDDMVIPSLKRPFFMKTEDFLLTKQFFALKSKRLDDDFTSHLYRSSAALVNFLVLNDGLEKLREFLKRGAEIGWDKYLLEGEFYAVYGRSFRENDKLMELWYAKLQNKFGRFHRQISKEKFCQVLKEVSIYLKNRLNKVIDEAIARAKSQSASKKISRMLLSLHQVNHQHIFRPRLLQLKMNQALHLN